MHALRPPFIARALRLLTPLLHLAAHRRSSSPLVVRLPVVLIERLRLVARVTRPAGRVFKIALVPSLVAPKAVRIARLWVRRVAALPLLASAPVPLLHLFRPVRLILGAFSVTTVHRLSTLVRATNPNSLVAMRVFVRPAPRTIGPAWRRQVLAEALVSFFVAGRWFSPFLSVVLQSLWAHRGL